jgi:hypothetical protein
MRGAVPRGQHSGESIALYGVVLHWNGAGLSCVVFSLATTLISLGRMGVNAFIASIDLVDARRREWNEKNSYTLQLLNAHAKLFAYLT